MPPIRPYLPQPGPGDPYPGVYPYDLARPPGPEGGAVPADYGRTPRQDPAAQDPYAGLSDIDRRAAEPDKWSPYGTMVGGPQLSQTPGQGLTPLNRANIPGYRQAGYGGGAGGIYGGGAGGIPGVGGGQALVEYGQAAAAERHLPGIIGLAGRETRAIEAGAQDIPYGPGGYALPLLQQGLERQISAPGMSPVEYTQAKRRITQGFGAQTGALASAGAKGGFFSPSSVAQAGGGAPTQQLGQGLAELEAKNAEIQRREREAGIRTLASQYGTLSGQALGPRSAYLARVGQYQEQTPVTRQGISTTSPSSTFPGPIAGGGSRPSSNNFGIYGATVI